jgi:hypothetical protein
MRSRLRERGPLRGLDIKTDDTPVMQVMQAIAMLWPQTAPADRKVSFDPRVPVSHGIIICLLDLE